MCRDDGMDNKSKLSRKFIISHVAILLSMGLPILYKHMGIGDPITMTVLAMVSFSALGYNVVNAAVKKIDPND